MFNFTVISADRFRNPECLGMSLLESDGVIYSVGFYANKYICR